MDISNVKMLNYYALHHWIIREFGHGRKQAAYMLVYSFHDNKAICAVSMSYLAAFLDCTRQHAIRIMQELCAEGYIFCRSQGHGHTNIYEINQQKADEIRRKFSTSSNMDVTSIKASSNMDVTTTSNMDVTTTSNMDVTTTSNMDVTQITERIKETGNRECEREQSRTTNRQPTGDTEPNETPTHTQSAFLNFGTTGQVRLTYEEYEELLCRDYAEGHTLAGYFDSLEDQLDKGRQYPSHFKKICRWIDADLRTASKSTSIAITYDAYGEPKGGWGGM